MHRVQMNDMEEGLILISQLNDFIFCPISIYFHNLYNNEDNRLFQRTDQVEGRASHKSIDNQTYSTRKDVLLGIDVFSEKYGLIGKIDMFDCATGILTERKKKIKNIFDGYVFQLYAQYYCMEEMGFNVSGLRLYSMDDNKVYPVLLPDSNLDMRHKFFDVLNRMSTFDVGVFEQVNKEKCKGCIYEPICDRSLI